jgi:hypothetical protein
MRQGLFVAAIALAVACIALLVLWQSDRSEPGPVEGPGERAGPGAATLRGAAARPGPASADQDGGPSAARASRGGARSLPAGFTDAVRGRVVGPDGEGVAGVTLGIRVIPPRTPNRNATRPMGGAIFDPLRAWHVRGDDAGRFELTDVNLDGGVAEIAARILPPGFAMPPPLRVALRGEAVLLRLASASPITGTVLRDPQGDPTARVRVCGFWREAGVCRATRAVADAEGRFTLHHLPRNVRVDVVVTRLRSGLPSRRRFASVLPADEASYGDVAKVVLGVESGTDGVEIELAQRLRPALRAVSADGRALASLRFHVGATHGGPWTGYDVVSSSDGELALGPLPAGAYRIAPADRTDPPTAPVLVLLPSSVAKIVFGPPALHRVPGRIAGAGNLAGFRILVRAEGEEAPRVSFARADGGFDLGLAEGVRYDLRAERFGDERCGFVRGVQAADGEVEIPLQTGHSIGGRILDVDGEPLNVQGWATASNEQFEARQATTKGGRFTFHGLPPGRYTVRAGDAGSTLAAVVEDVAAGTLDLELRLPRTR